MGWASWALIMRSRLHCSDRTIEGRGTKGEDNTGDSLYTANQMRTEDPDGMSAFGITMRR